MSTAAPLRVIQISDFHLKTQPGSRLWGVDVDAGLNAVLEHIQLKHPAPDLVLATGDLVGDDPNAYAGVPTFWNRWGRRCTACRAITISRRS